MFSVQSKVVVVTGGASGIGAAVVARLRAAGAVVVVGDIAGVDGGDRVRGGDGDDVIVDVAHEDQVATLLDGVVAAHGRLDLLVNSAGVGLEASPLVEETTARMLRLFRVNTLGVLYGTKHAARLMPDGGAIVNVGSLAGDLAWADNAAYAVSKSGVLALTRAAAVELAAQGIRVNAVQPSMIETPMVAHDTPAVRAERAYVTQASPQGRVGDAESVAAAVHFLGSDDCGYLTGQVITVDGGLTAGPAPSLLADLVRRSH